MELFVMEANKKSWTEISFFFFFTGFLSPYTLNSWLFSYGHNSLKINIDFILTGCHICLVGKGQNHLY